eukprot:scaffold49983_cov67-Phaeocystis_antarctica.AAC.1
MQSARAASTPAGVGLMGAPRLASWSRPGQRSIKSCGRKGFEKLRPSPGLCSSPGGRHPL